MSAQPAPVLDTPERERETSALGMWVFLATEVMFFGPLFLGYLHGRTHQYDAFVTASSQTHGWLGTINTALLLTSSLAMALAVRSAQACSAKGVVRLLGITAALGAAMMASREVPAA